MRLFLRNNKGAGAERLRFQSSFTCSDRRSTLPAFHWCSVPSCGGCRLLGQLAPGRAAPGKNHFQPVFGKHAGFLASPALVSLGALCSRVHCGKLNHRRRKLSPREEESSNPTWQGQVTKVPVLTVDRGECIVCACCL